MPQVNNVIIGVHGIANKPKPETLAHWWKCAIKEGWAHAKLHALPFDFKMIHWADYIYDKPINPVPQRDAYRPTFDRPAYYRNGALDRITRDIASFGGAALDWMKKKFGVETIAHAVNAVKMKEVYAYHNIRRFRLDLDKLFLDALRAAEATIPDRIVVVAHSMGTVVAYHALREYERDRSRGRDRDAPIRLVTIGSPLGMPHVIHEINKRWYDTRTPNTIRSWKNFADKRDPVAVDPFLRDDFDPNAFGVIPEDDLVLNPRGPIHHRSYDYLRAPEVASAIWRALA